MSKLNIATKRNEYVSCELYSDSQLKSMIYIDPSFCSKKIAINDGKNTVYLVTGKMPDSLLEMDPEIKAIPLKFADKDGVVLEDTVYNKLPDLTLTRGALVTSYTANVSTPITLLASDYPNGVEIVFGGSKGANGSAGSSGTKGKGYDSSSDPAVQGTGGAGGSGGAGGKNATIKFTIGDKSYSITASGGGGGGGGGGGQTSSNNWYTLGGAGGSGGAGGNGTGVILRFIGIDVTINSISFANSGANGSSGSKGQDGQGNSMSAWGGKGGTGGRSGTGQYGSAGAPGTDYMQTGGGKGGNGASATTRGVVSCDYPYNNTYTSSTAYVNIYKCNMS